MVANRPASRIEVSGPTSLDRLLRPQLGERTANAFLANVDKTAYHSQEHIVEIDVKYQAKNAPFPQ